ncbi:MAG: beta propeller repeat protein, partial [Planctomycetota bacterium]
PADNLFRDSEERFLIKFICSVTGSIDKLVFGDMCPNVTQSRPAILVKANDRWLVLPFEGDLLRGHGWEYVGSTPDRIQMFAVLDNQIEDPGWDLVILASSDGGQTWKLRSTLRKVCYYAGFHDFVMDHKGRGRITILLGDDYTDDIKAGLYHYRTTDAGYTWASPEYEPNYLYKRSCGTRPRTIYSLSDITD